MSSDSPIRAMPFTSRDVSVVMPCFNGERYLRAAIESVVGQSRPPLEVIVVDDGSTDSTSEIAGTWGSPVTVVRQANRGVAAARNSGVRLSRGRLVAFLDADDLWVENKLERQLEVLNSDLDVGCVFGHAVQFISPDVSEEVRRSLVCPPGAMSAPVHGAMLIRRDILDRLGPLDEGLGLAEVIGLLAMLKDAAIKTVTVPEVLLRRRIHGDNLSLKRKADRVAYARALKKVLDRRRKLNQLPDHEG
jgi:glycosyltransferase involved in cell wall biosynthesis